MSSEREALEETISQGIGWAEYAWVPQDTGNYNTSRLMFIKSLGKQATDNAIAHLWSRADDPDTYTEVASKMYRRHDLNTFEMGTAQQYMIMMLETLLGPRPTEQEAER